MHYHIKMQSKIPKHQDRHKSKKLNTFEIDWNLNGKSVCKHKLKDISYSFCECELKCVCVCGEKKEPSIKIKIEFRCRFWVPLKSTLIWNKVMHSYAHTIKHFVGSLETYHSLLSSSLLEKRRESWVFTFAFWLYTHAHCNMPLEYPTTAQPY